MLPVVIALRLLSFLALASTQASGIPAVTNVSNSDGTLAVQCTGAQNTDCYPNTCSSHGTVSRRALSLTNHSMGSDQSFTHTNDTLTSHRISNTSAPLDERDILSILAREEQDTITGSGGARKDVLICGKTYVPYKN